MHHQQLHIRHGGVTSARAMTMNERQRQFPFDVDDNEQQFFFTLVGMAKFALEHPSKSRFEYISPGQVRANSKLKIAFMSWWWAEHPAMTDAQQELFEDSIRHGLCPGGVVEHIPDGHHPIGWSWGSEWYLADYYLCLTRAIIQHAVEVGNDVKSEYAPIHIAKEVFAQSKHSLSCRGISRRAGWAPPARAAASTRSTGSAARAPSSSRRSCSSRSIAPSNSAIQ